MAEHNYLDPDTWRLATPGGIRYKLLERTGNYDLDQVTCTEKVLIEAVKLQAFIREVFPLPTFLNNLPVWQASAMPGVFPILTKSIAWQAHVPGLPIDPFSADPNAPAGTYHPIIQVDITYNDSSDQPGSGGGKDVDENDPETFLEISATASAEFLELDDSCGSFYLDATGAVVGYTADEVKPHKLIPEISWTITWPMLNYEFYKTVMLPRLRGATGKVNATTYGLLYDAPAQTLLCTGWNATEEHQVLFADETEQNGQYVGAPVKLTVNILERNQGIVANTGTRPPNSEETLEEWLLLPAADVKIDEPIYAGHNHVWSKQYGYWLRFLPRRLLYNSDTGGGIYDTYEFNDLFAIPESQ